MEGDDGNDRVYLAWRIISRLKLSLQRWTSLGRLSSLQAFQDYLSWYLGISLLNSSICNQAGQLQNWDCQKWQWEALYRWLERDAGVICWLDGLWSAELYREPREFKLAICCTEKRWNRVLIWNNSGALTRKNPSNGEERNKAHGPRKISVSVKGFQADDVQVRNDVKGSNGMSYSPWIPPSQLHSPNQSNHQRVSALSK